MRNRLFFVLLLLAVTSLGSPGASAQNRSVSSPVEVVRCDSLTVYYPRFSRMDLATGSMPSKTDSTVIFCCAAAFTGEKLPTFKHSNIAGHHVSGGQFHEGFHCGPNNGVFTWTPAKGARYYNFSHQNSRPPLKEAAGQGGMGFCQSLLYYNGKRFKGCFKADRANRYRALCEIGGRLCIVDCARNLPFGSFMDGLKALGVRNAVYCDMGRGWNYSWYRDAAGTVHELFPTPGRYTTNWIVFYK